LSWRGDLKSTHTPAAATAAATGTPPQAKLHEEEQEIRAELADLMTLDGEASR
jgi:hypothetical protein